MKTTNILYWTITGMFAAFMMYSGLSDFLQTENSKMVMGYLGYPEYFSRFIGLAKIVGSIAILIPGFPRLKEWVYAGFTFDLLGATYSTMALGFDPGQLTMLVFFAFLFASYWLHHKRLKQVTARP